MTKKKPVGWRNEPVRHGLAARGIPTAERMKMIKKGVDEATIELHERKIVIAPLTDYIIRRLKEGEFIPFVDFKRILQGEGLWRRYPFKSLVGDDEMVMYGYINSMPGVEWDFTEWRMTEQVSPSSVSTPLDGSPPAVIVAPIDIEVEEVKKVEPYLVLAGETPTKIGYQYDEITGKFGPD